MTRCWITLMVMVAIAMISLNVLAQYNFPWRQLHGGTKHSGTWDNKIASDNITSGWTLDPANATPGTVTFNTSTHPCCSLEGDYVYAYADTTNSSMGVIIAAGAGSGTVKWATPVYSFTEYSSWSSPVYHQGYVYWAGTNYDSSTSPATSTTYVYKIKASNGSCLTASGGWIAKLDDTQIVNGTPVVTDDNVFLSTYGGFSPSTSKQLALNVSDGSTLWEKQYGGQGQGAMAYDSTTGYLYQTTYVGGVHNISAINSADGAIIWTSTFEVTNAFLQNAVTIKGNYVYAQDYSFSGTGKIYKVNKADGSLLWSADNNNAGSGCLTVDSDGNVYACGDFSGTGTTNAYASDGSLLWTFTQGGGWSNSPVWANDYVVVGAQDSNTLYVLNDSDGSVAATLEGGSGPVSFGNRYFYSIGFDKKLYAFSVGSDSEISKLQIGLDNSDENKDKITVTKGSLPDGLEMSETPGATVKIGSYEIECDDDLGEWKIKSNKYTYTSDSKEPRVQLTIDTGKKEWTAKITKCNAQGLIDFNSSVQVLLNADGTYVGKTYSSTEITVKQNASAKE